MPELETPEEFRRRMQSVGFLSQGRTKDKVRTIRREPDGGIDAGLTAKQTTDELGTVITESANRQDVNICPPTVYQTLSFNGEEV
jgi:hypothetical protein